MFNYAVSLPIETVDNKKKNRKKKVFSFLNLKLNLNLKKL